MSRLRKLKQEIDELTISMQTFCLDPSLHLYNSICNNKSVRREEGFDIWQLYCLYKYGPDWGNCGVDYDCLSKKQEDINNLVELSDDILCNYVLEKPSQTASMSILYAFCATGELRYIDLFYQCMGHELLPLPTRQYLAKLFLKLKEAYREKIQKLKDKNPNHFDTLDVKTNVIDFTYFDNIKTKYKKTENQESQDKQ